MKISDWKSKVQALFRPAPQERAPALNNPRELAAKADHKPVEISILSTGERFVYDPKSSRVAEIGESDKDSSGFEDNYAQYLASRERDAAAALQQWDRKSVQEIATEPFHEFPNLESHLAISATVPSAARQQFWNPSPQNEFVRNSVTLLAIDDRGEALVKSYSVDDHRDADGQSYKVMPLGDALALLQEYGAAKDLIIESGGIVWHGSTPFQAKSPELGQAYRGAILAIQGDRVYQQQSDSTVIAHVAGRLSVPNAQQFAGKEVDISYPCGRVGLMRQVETVAHEASALQKASAEKTSAALER